MKLIFSHNAPHLRKT